MPGQVFVVQVRAADGKVYYVGPFLSGGGLGSEGRAIDWVYKQIGLLKTHFPRAELLKHRWNYRESGYALLPDQTLADVHVEIAGYSFEIMCVDGESVNCVDPVMTWVLPELIEPRPIVENL